MRLSSHILFIETGRYKRPVIDGNERKCITCSVLEDEKHALFICRAHNSIRNNYRKLLYEYPTTERMLNPIKEEDIIRIAKYIREIEMNMKNLQMMRYLKGIKFRGYLISRFFSFDNSRVLNFAILSC